MSNKIDINNKNWYMYNAPHEHNERTRNRLQEIIDLGLRENGIACFGLPGTMSGLYIEKLWNLDENGWKGYIDWIKSIMPKKDLIKSVYYKYFKKEDVDTRMHISINGFISSENLRLIQQIGFLAEFDTNKHTARPIELRDIGHDND